MRPKEKLPRKCCTFIYPTSFMSLEQKSQPADVSAKSSGGCKAELWFSSGAVLLVVCSVKNCLPQVVKDRCPLLKGIPNKSKVAFVFNSAKDKVVLCFFFRWRLRRKNFVFVKQQLPGFWRADTVFHFSLSWRNFGFCLFRCLMNKMQETWGSQIMESDARREHLKHWARLD